MNTYDGFLLDADNTLFDYDAAEAEALDETLQAVVPSVPRETARGAYRAINSRYWRMLEEGAVSMADLKVGRFADLLRALGVPGDAGAVSMDYIDRLADKAFLLPHARRMLEALARRARICLVSNGIAAVQRGRLAKAGIASCFSAILVSEELGFAKPDPRVYRAAADALGLPTSRLLCVGDNPIADVAGAMKAGIDACWYAPGGGVWPGPGAPPHIIIRDLMEIMQYAPGVFP